MEDLLQECKQNEEQIENSTRERIIEADSVK